MPSALDKYRKAPAGGAPAPLLPPPSLPTPPPPSSFERPLSARAADVAIGAGKGLTEAITSISDLLSPIINQMTQQSFGSRAALPEDAPSASELLGLGATNPEQSAGKLASFAVPFAPAAGRLVSRAVKTGRALQAARAPASRAVADTTARAIPDITTPLPRLVKKASKRLTQDAPITDEQAKFVIEHVSKTHDLTDPVIVKQVIDAVPEVAVRLVPEKTLRNVIASELGGVNPKVATMIASGTAGAAIGGSQGETPEDRLTNAAIGGTAGLLVPVLGVSLARSVKSGGSAGDAFQRYVHNAVLLNPESISRAWLGSMGGTVTAATEKIAAGVLTGNRQLTADGTRILNHLFSGKSIKAYEDALRNPTAHQGIVGQIGKSGTPSMSGRIFGALDAAGRAAMQAGGISADDAARYALAGEPTTKTGKQILDLLSKAWPAKFITSLYPRVGINIIERGLERTPLSLLDAGKSLRMAGTREEQLVRAAEGPAAALAAYFGAGAVPEEFDPYLSAASGPLALATGPALAAGRARQRGGDFDRQQSAAIGEAARNLPLPLYGTAAQFHNVLGGSMLVPSILRDVAEYRDPFDRDPRGQTFGQARAKIPGLREDLPVRPRRTNLAGEPLQPKRRTSGLRRALTSPAREANPFKNVPAAVRDELQRLQIDVRAPAFQRTITLRGRKVPINSTELSEAQQRDSRVLLLPLLEKVVTAPAYQQLDDDGLKTEILNRVIERANEAGGKHGRKALLQGLASQVTR